MRKVKIMVVAQRPREVFVRPGETMLGLLKRLSSPSWPLLEVGSWYQNSKPVDRTLTLLRDGDVLAGAPKVRGCGGPRPSEQKKSLSIKELDEAYTRLKAKRDAQSAGNIVTLMISGYAPLQIAILPGEDLLSFTQRAERGGIPTEGVGEWFVNGRGVRWPSANTIPLRQGMTIAGVMA